MPKQTETLSVCLPTRSDKEDPPRSAAAIGLSRLWLGSLLSCPGNVFGEFLSPCNPLLSPGSLKHSPVLSGKQSRLPQSRRSGNNSRLPNQPPVTLRPIPTEESAFHTAVSPSPLGQKGVNSCYKLQDPVSNYVIHVCPQKGFTY